MPVARSASCLYRAIMTFISHARMAVSGFAITALLLASASAAASTAKPVKTKPPVLSCKTAGTDGMTYTVIKAGKGEKPGADSKVKVNYKGHLKSDGTVFDEGSGAEFKVGGVIAGVAQGLQLMQPGGKYRLCIPYALAYGEAGSGPIPAKADLVFEVDLLSFQNPPPKHVVPAEQRSCDQVTASGLGYAISRQGTGRKPTDTDMVLVDFMTFDATTGIADNKTEWETIPLNQATLLFGEALKMMPAGSSYRFCFPKPPESEEPVVNIAVDLIDVRPAPPPAW